MSEDANPEIKSLTTCQQCGVTDPNLNSIDSGLRLTLSKMGGEIPTAVCSKCLKQLRKSASQGAHLQAKEEAKAKFTSDLWKSRTTVVKQGRANLNRGDYAQAALAYEKYLKVVSVVSKKDRKSIDPKDFNAHPKEITIIASVLWDLMLIYDSHIKFADKQMETAEVLAKFLRFSPVYNGIIRKAEKETRSGRNPAAFKHLLKLCDAQASRCFIANAAFETRTDPTVIQLCLFRDEVLKKKPMGRSMVKFYYRHSPVAAALINQHPTLKKPLRRLLQGVAALTTRIFNLPGKPQP